MDARGDDRRGCNPSGVGGSVVSGKVTGWVLEHSPATGAARMVLVVLADHANSDGSNAWPSVQRIAREARCSTSTVHRVLRELEADGYVTREGITHRGCVHYRVVMTPPILGGVRSSEGSDPVPATPPRIGPEPTTEPSSSVSARVREPKFDGKPIDRDLLAAAEKALDWYSQRTGQTPTAFNRHGQPAESLKRIIGAMADHPSLRTNFRRVIDATLEAPWWDGPASVGVIFGPNAIDKSIARASSPPQIGSTRRNGRSRLVRPSEVAHLFENTKGEPA